MQITLVNDRRFVFRVALAAGLLVWLGPTSCDDILPETSRMDTHVADARQAVVPDRARRAPFPPTGVWPLALAISISEPATSGRCLRHRRPVPRDGRLGEEVGPIVCQSILIRYVTNTSFLGGAVRGVRVRMPMLVAIHLFPVPMFSWPMRVPMPSQNSKPSQVRCEPQATNDQDELRVADLGGVDESCKRFEDDGYAKGDEKYGVEEGAQDLGTEPLRRTALAYVFLARGRPGLQPTP